jgi:peptidoglycan/LPS O-acetylase OafA/YrhL
MRAVAVLMVVIVHTWPNLLPGGGIGVDVFFVLSGFLITTLLLEEHDRTGRVGLRHFYLRRALRLLPALAATVVVAFVLSLLLVPTARRRPPARPSPPSCTSRTGSKP